MKTESMLNSLAQLLETYAMGDDAINESDVVVTEIAEIVDDSMVITLMGNDGDFKTFLITEVDD